MALTDRIRAFTTRTCICAKGTQQGLGGKTARRADAACFSQVKRQVFCLPSKKSTKDTSNGKLCHCFQLQSVCHLLRLTPTHIHTHTHTHTHIHTYTSVNDMTGCVLQHFHTHTHTHTHTHIHTHLCRLCSGVRPLFASVCAAPPPFAPYKGARGHHCELRTKRWDDHNTHTYIHTYMLLQRLFPCQVTLITTWEVRHKKRNAVLSMRTRFACPQYTHAHTAATYAP